MTEVLAVTKSGVDIGTATNPNDFIFHSSYNTFKIVQAGTGSFDVAGSTILGSAGIVHNYGTRTGFMVFFKYPKTGRITYDENWVDNAAGTESVYCMSIENSSGTINVTTWNDDAAAQTVKYSYYLFEIPT